MKNYYLGQKEVLGRHLLRFILVQSDRHMVEGRRGNVIST